MRRIVIAIIAVVVVLGVIGALASGGKSTPTAAPLAAVSQAPVASVSAPVAPITIASAAPASVAPVASPITLLALSGDGIKTSKQFSASGDSVDVAYTFNCASFGSQGNFQVMFYGANSDPALPDMLVNALATKGSDATTEYLNGAAGPFHVEVNSECSWTLKVLGTR